MQASGAEALLADLSLAGAGTYNSCSVACAAIFRKRLRHRREDLNCLNDICHRHGSRRRAPLGDIFAIFQ